MEELIKLLDKDLRLTAWEINGDTIYIKAVSVKEEAICPFCGQVSYKIHSTYRRIFLRIAISCLNHAHSTWFSTYNQNPLILKIQRYIKENLKKNFARRHVESCLILPRLLRYVVQKIQRKIIEKLYSLDKNRRSEKASDRKRAAA